MSAIMKKKSTILIIEDNDDIRTSIVEILEMAFYDVIEATNGKKGVELALAHLPDIILCDITMPELDGYGVFYMLNNNPDTLGIPFIFLTAKAEHLDLRKGMEMGADDYLTKPFDDMELLNAIDVRLKKKTAIQNKIQQSAEEFKILVSKTDGLSEFNNLIKGNKSRDYKKNHIVYYEEDHGKGLYLILEGKVKTIKLSEDGRELMTGLYSAGDYLGTNAILSNGPYTDTATATEDSKLCLIPTEQLNTVLNMYPDVARKFIFLLSNDNKDKEEQLLQLAYHSVRKKMAGTIIRLHNLQVSKSFFNITREDLAAMACMAMETVSRTLSDFKEEKLIERAGNSITILNLEGLSKMKN
jgi:CRP-like cAMP-binding protein/CheY-like chemotaxis protein